MDNPDRSSAVLPNRQWRIFDQEQWNPDRFAADHSAARRIRAPGGWWGFALRSSSIIHIHIMESLVWQVLSSIYLLSTASRTIYSLL